ncbi:uncharacterized protein I303_103447 [Kwoniella dejecticola CBS 10117]|uniref:TPR repeat-containing protein n=1 Tax=Kwoniella dejecticola CBS 10117 TaxID=1296121 RepID=A0A1A6A6U6_9TREE|nr:TPR repeat-containing protein [Kwoniella dejecticola CBS 10117]OBR85758.1 TPR repeat-containing protein [Kwoniella dejecticola CBS 10117]
MDSLEWSILRGQGSAAEAGPSRARELAGQLAEADFNAILTSTEAKSIFSGPQLLEGLNIPSSSSAPDAHGLEAESSPLIRLIVAVALLHSFVQANWTGPNLTFTPLDFLPSPSQPTAASASASSSSSTSNDELNALALPLLTLQGEPAYHLASQPVLFLLARRLFLSLATSTSDSVKILPIWLLRLHLVHLSLLDEAVSLPTESISAVQALLDDPTVVADQDLKATIELEIGLYHHAVGQEKLANQSFLAAARASELEFELTGALGKKTKYQVALLSQLVLLAESRKRQDEGETDTVESQFETVAEPGPKNGQSETKSTLPESIALNDDTLLEETEFTKVTSSSSSSPDKSTSKLSHLDPSNQPPLHPLDQALLLSLCLSQHNNSPSSGLTANQMMPFLSRVIAHPRNWSIHTTGLLLRSRLESTRSRTVERSTLQLQALIEQMPTSDSSPKERLQYFHQLPLSSKWDMERELAKRFLSIGVTRSALEIFDRLEMWEDSVGCLQRLDREEEAIKLVRDLIEGKKIESDTLTTMGKANLSEKRRNKLTEGRKSKLFCLLGDLSLSSEESVKDPVGAKKRAIEMYEQAWEVSNKTSSRAMRSLGALYVGGQAYEKAIECFKAALEINPLYARVWFTLGVCYSRLGRWTEAKDAYRRQVGVEEDDAEGWNNLAAVYLRIGEDDKKDGESAQPATTTATFENKHLAWRALLQGLRFAYSNWRMWQNYMIVSIDVGELSEAARAMTRVVEELSDKNPLMAVDFDVLDKLVDSVTRDDYSLLKEGKVVPKTSNEGFGLLPLVERLFDQTILPRISDSSRVWKSHARLLRWKDDSIGALEDYIKAYRWSIVFDESVERDKAKWLEAINEIEILVATMSQLGPKAKIQAQVEAEAEAAAEKEGGNGKKKVSDWKFQARGIVRTFMGRTKESFEYEKDWERLQELLDDLKKSD